MSYLFFTNQQVFLISLVVFWLCTIIKSLHDLVPYSFTERVCFWLEIFVTNPSTWIFNILKNNHRCVFPVNIFVPVNYGQISSSFILLFPECYLFIVINKSGIIIRLYVMRIDTSNIIFWSFVYLKLFDG